MSALAIADKNKEEAIHRKDALIIGHCVLNMNTRAPGISIWSGAVIPIYEMLKGFRGEIHQYPCLEAAVNGMRRWWQVKEQYDNYLFREFSARVVSLFVNYFLEKGINSVYILGLGLSPTCGFRFAQSDPTWGGRPHEIDISKNFTKSSGVLIEEFQKGLQNVKIDFKILDLAPILIYPGNRYEYVPEYPRTADEAIREICNLLNVNCNNINKNVPNTDKDMRSGKTLAITFSEFQKSIDKIEKYVNEGYGISLIEPIFNDDEEEDFLSTVYAAQFSNLLKINHTVVILNKGDMREKSLIHSIVQKIYQRQRFESMKIILDL